MFSVQPVGRRLVLRRFAQAGPVCATILLPAVASAASLAGTLSSRGAGLSAAPLPLPPMPPAAPSAPPPIVMLDPGHGGKDPGAIGVSGTYEKAISLATALELRRLLEAGGRYRVRLTRSRDVFVPLEERVARAQENGAALFVSMHADALMDHSVRGASVYTLGNGASDPQSAALARRENAAGGSRSRAVEPDWEVAQVIVNMMRQEARDGSLRIARQMVGSLDRDLPMLPNPARHAGFAVLQSASIPSVLVEMGFMSNPRDEAALRRPDHRHQVAQAMQRAIEAYFTARGAAVAAAG